MRAVSLFAYHVLSIPPGQNGTIGRKFEGSSVRSVRLKKRRLRLEL